MKTPEEIEKLKVELERTKIQHEALPHGILKDSLSDRIKSLEYILSHETIETAVVKVEPKPVTTPDTYQFSPEDIEVTAENATEMQQCQDAIIQWTQMKVSKAQAEANELKAAYEHAVQRKWKSDTLKRHAELASKRADFYKRMLVALEKGYQIVPSFPVTAFAIRTDAKNPLRMYSTSWSHRHTQQAKILPEGEGEYKNPFPVVSERQLKAATQTESEKKAYWAESWKDLEFPISMSKPKVMEATTRAMALKVFDEIGILPGFAPEEGTRPPAGDPMIIARMKVPNWVGANQRWVCFIIAWHLDTRTL